MDEMAGYDSRRKWDAAYSRSEGSEPEPGPQEQAIVAVLRDLAGGGPVLELAVGGGRIAIPLAATGVDVDGIDISPNAIDQLRAHPQGGAVNASVADISDFALDRKYSLIYCVANSLFNVLTQDGQIRCLELVAAHLAPDGVFLVHSSYTPSWFETLRNGQYVEARHLELGFAFLQALRVDPAEQLVYQQNISLTSDGIALSPTVHRYASLGELDLMARIAGLKRLELWGSWTREPFSGSTTWGGLSSPMLLATYGAA
jgi:SAM-dependent methyltransferase